MNKYAKREAEEQWRKRFGKEKEVEQKKLYMKINTWSLVDMLRNFDITQKQIKYNSYHCLMT